MANNKKLANKQKLTEEDLRNIAGGKAGRNHDDPLWRAAFNSYSSNGNIDEAMAQADAAVAKRAD